MGAQQRQKRRVTLCQSRKGPPEGPERGAEVETPSPGQRLPPGQVPCIRPPPAGAPSWLTVP